MNLSAASTTIEQGSSRVLRDTSDAASGPGAVKKLRKAAAEFEAMLLSSWWTTMKQSGLSKDDGETDPGKDTLDQLGMQAMSAAVSTGRGGLGIGDMLVRSLLAKHPEITGGDSPGKKGTE